MTEKQVLRAYETAKEVYAGFGVDTEAAIERFLRIPVSVHNWQADDVRGLEGSEGLHSENVVTGNYPGRAATGEQIRQDYEQAFRFSPMKHRINLHSMYAEPRVKKERCDLTAEDFRPWIDWAKEKGFAMDFNVSYFTHRMMKNGCSLASSDREVREYWIRAGIGGRRIAAAIGRELGEPCVNNTWVPDGTKDRPYDRAAWRRRLTESLDRILEEPFPREELIDVLEGKLFGIGSECFVAGSHDFYLAYAVKKGIGVTMDTGHYHPTESVADKLTAVSPFLDYIMLHLSRGVRWDSDHCLIQDDALRDILLELTRQDLLNGRVGLGLDYFDATVNRVSAWVVGLRALGRTLLQALLEPGHLLARAEAEEDGTGLLALMEEFRNLPAGAVWDYLCLRSGTRVGASWLEEMKAYERKVQFLR